MHLWIIADYSIDNVDRRPYDAHIAQIAWRTYAIPFAAAFTTAHGVAHQRTGAIVRVRADSGLVGLGEIAPLPEFGGGTLADALAGLPALADGLLGGTVGQALDRLDRLDYAAAGVAAQACGLDTALLDVAAQAAGLPLARLLSPGASAQVPVNATIGAAGRAAAVAAAAQAAEAGFGCVKLKVGVAPTRTDEIERIAAVRSALGPNLRLRLDANGAWGVAEAIAIIRAAERYGIELVEQPVAAHDLAGMAQVRRAVGAPIAADEAVGGPEQARLVIAAGAADVLIIKPMLAGGLRRAQAIGALAQAAGLHTIVTTTIDTGVGVAAALHLAATLPPPQPACGLATGALLASDLLAEPLAVRHGALRLPARPGLGVALDLHALERYAGAWQHCINAGG